MGEIEGCGEDGLVLRRDKLRWCDVMDKAGMQKSLRIAHHSERLEDPAKRPSQVVIQAIPEEAESVLTIRPTKVVQEIFMERTMKVPVEVHAT